jgi:hypothetical protein
VSIRNCDLLPHDGGVRSHARAPERVRQDDGGFGALTVLIGDEGASSRGTYAGRAEIIFCDEGHVRQPRVGTNTYAEAALAARGYRFKDLSCPFPVTDKRRIQERPGEPVAFGYLENDDALRLVNRQGPEQDRFDKRENRRGRANAEPQGQDGCESKARAAAQQPKRVPGVVQHAISPA